MPELIADHLPEGPAAGSALVGIDTIVARGAGADRLRVHRAHPDRPALVVGRRSGTAAYRWSPRGPAVQVPARRRLDGGPPGSRISRPCSLLPLPVGPGVGAGRWSQAVSAAAPPSGQAAGRWSRVSRTSASLPVGAGGRRPAEQGGPGGLCRLPSFATAVHGRWLPRAGARRRGPDCGLRSCLLMGSLRGAISRSACRGKVGAVVSRNRSCRRDGAMAPRCVASGPAAMAMHCRLPDHVGTVIRPDRRPTAMPSWSTVNPPRAGLGLVGRVPVGHLSPVSRSAGQESCTPSGQGS
jgi:hypothetical protein